MKLGQLRKLIAEEAKRALIKETSDSLNHLIGFADVFANLPRHIRLDILRVVEGDFEKVNPQNISQALDVLHGLNPELDQALENFVDHHEGQDNSDLAAEGADPGTQGHDEGEDEDEETYNHRGFDGLDEVAPPGWEGTVKAMKKHKNISNPWALAWSEKNKGYKSHKKS
jgi:hypothetical protein